jgi:hypothetical protein
MEVGSDTNEQWNECEHLQAAGVEDENGDDTDAMEKFREQIKDTTGQATQCLDPPPDLPEGMYVMYICMYVCMYVCILNMYVCQYKFIFFYRIFCVFYPLCECSLNDIIM